MSAGYARSTTVNCTAHNALGGQVAAATPQGPVTFTLSSDGSYALGSLTLHPSDYKPYAQYEGIDRATFPSFGNDRLISAGNGSIKIALQMDAEDASVGVTFQNGYDSGTCTLPTQP